MNSYVIWFNDGRYTYAWGSSPEEALAAYLDNWRRGIAKVVPADDYRDALPQHRYLPGPANAAWPGAEPVAHQPLYGPGITPASALPSTTGFAAEPSLAEQVAFLQSQVDRLLQSQKEPDAQG